MKFFHVYNEDCFKGLEKNGLLNADSGFKLQHCFAVPKDRLFNTYAAVGTPPCIISSRKIIFPSTLTALRAASPTTPISLTKA